eukprot:247100-Prymnesium_polylepis.1
MARATRPCLPPLTPPTCPACGLAGKPHGLRRHHRQVQRRRAKDHAQLQAPGEEPARGADHAVPRRVQQEEGGRADRVEGRPLRPGRWLHRLQRGEPCQVDPQDGPARGPAHHPAAHRAHDRLRRQVQRPRRTPRPGRVQGGEGARGHRREAARRGSHAKCSRRGGVHEPKGGALELPTRPLATARRPRTHGATGRRMRLVAGVLSNPRRPRAGPIWRCAQVIAAFLSKAAKDGSLRQLSFIEFSKLTKPIDHVLHTVEVGDARDVWWPHRAGAAAADGRLAGARRGRVTHRSSLGRPHFAADFARPCTRRVHRRSAAALAPISYVERVYNNDIPTDGPLAGLLNTPGAEVRRIA